MHHGIRDIKRSMRTRARTKDFDQIHDDLARPQVPLVLADEDLPGGGLFTCIHVIKYFLFNNYLYFVVREAFH